jgi:SAM-dependent methyltransferase
MIIQKYPRDQWQPLQYFGDFVLNWVKGCIVEIGCGTTTVVLYNLAERWERDFYSCDLKRDGSGIRKKNNMSDRYKPTKESSDDFAKHFNQEISFAFIDGCHKYEFIKRDFKFIYSLLRPGGVVFMHDTLPPSERHARPGACNDAYKFRLELEKREDIEIISWPYPNYYGLSMVIKKLRCWLPPEEEKWD